MYTHSYQLSCAMNGLQDGIANLAVPRANDLSINPVNRPLWMGYKTWREAGIVWTHPIKKHNPILPPKIMNIPHTPSVPRNRTLTENVFTLCKRSLCRAIPRTDGCADIHRRDVEIVEESLVGGVRLGEMVGVFGVVL